MPVMMKRITAPQSGENSNTMPATTLRSPKKIAHAREGASPDCTSVTMPSTIQAMPTSTPRNTARNAVACETFASASTPPTTKRMPRMMSRALAPPEIPFEKMPRPA